MSNEILWCLVVSMSFPHGVFMVSLWCLCGIFAVSCCFHVVSLSCLHGIFLWYLLLFSIVSLWCLHHFYPCLPGLWSQNEVKSYENQTAWYLFVVSCCFMLCLLHIILWCLVVSCCVFIVSFCWCLVVSCGVLLFPVVSLWSCDPPFSWFLSISSFPVVFLWYLFVVSCGVMLFHVVSCLVYGLILDWKQ